MAMAESITAEVKRHHSRKIAADEFATWFEEIHESIVQGRIDAAEREATSRCVPLHPPPLIPICDELKLRQSQLNCGTSDFEVFVGRARKKFKELDEDRTGALPVCNILALTEWTFSNYYPNGSPAREWEKTKLTDDLVTATNINDYNLTFPIYVNWLRTMADKVKSPLRPRKELKLSAIITIHQCGQHILYLFESLTSSPSTQIWRLPLSSKIDHQQHLANQLQQLAEIEIRLLNEKSTQAMIRNGYVHQTPL
jgi:hypothetical protein